MKQFLLSALSVLALSSPALANNIQVSNVSVSGQDATAHFSLVNYNITWDNGWRTSTNESNYDGAWLFIKYRKANTSEWKHATLNTTGATEPAGATIKVSADGKGAWMYRSANGQGAANWTAAKIRWNYGVDGVNDNDSVEIKVFAVEMTYVPTGAFYLGSGGTGNNEFRKGGTTPITPYLVSSSGAITVANNATSLFYDNLSSGGGDQTGTIPATYPNGYNGYWLMKYEASQQQVADFLNHLDLAKANANNPGGFTGTHPAWVAPTPERAHGVSWKILIAYADWAGMRPYTEMEYEKACRGANITPVANECAWGNTSFVGMTTVVNGGAANETANPLTANCNYLTSYSTPARCGIFANSTSTRAQSGGGYYGNMELSGNEYEYVVTAGNTDGRAFTGLHGDGLLDGVGSANVTNWPVNSGYGTRGSSISTTIYPNLLQVSDRTAGVSSIYAPTAVGNLGIRLARTAE